MNGWNEDNFLEKAMPLLETKVETCPDAPTLSAVADGFAPVSTRQAVAAHTAQCSSCADLLRRMGAFSQTVAAGPEMEWIQVEQRLDGNMRQFLAAAPAPPPVARAPWWKLGWVLVPIAAVATVIVWLPKPATPPQTAAVRVDNVPATTPIPDKPAPGVANLVAEKPIKPAPPAPAAVTAPAAQPQPETPAATEPVETAAAPAPAPDPDQVVDPAPSHSLSRSLAPVVNMAGGQAGQSAPPASDSPSFVRINAGTRVWILLQSTSPESNGGFTFRGMVLLPVTQGGAVLLDRETRVVGSGKVNQGRTTIRIAEFVWQGRRYRLRGTALASRAPEPGSGPAVEFNAGQVLETWLASPSIYERVPGGPVPQG